MPSLLVKGRLLPAVPERALLPVRLKELLRLLTVVLPTTVPLRV